MDKTRQVICEREVEEKDFHTGRDIGERYGFVSGYIFGVLSFFVVFVVLWLIFM